MSRIVNIKYKCCGYNFDAAVDCDWDLCCYGASSEEKCSTTPIELYCLDHKEWDVRTIYQKNRNDQKTIPYAINHTEVDWGNLTKETRKWVREMKKK